MITHRIQLIQLLRDLNLPLIGAEVGVAGGNTSLNFFEAGMEKLYLVDRWGCHEGQKGDGGYPQDWHDKNFELTIENMKPYPGKYTILRGDSAEMANSIADGELSLVYLDADHSYEGVLRDLQAWYPKLCAGGIMAGHDYLNKGYGVYEAVHDFVNGRFEAVTIPETDTEPSINNASFYFIKTNQ